MEKSRRNFIKTVAVGAAALGVAPLALRAQGSTTPEFEWSMVTSWPKNFPGLGTAANNLAETINALSGGRIAVKVFAGGELVPPLEVFDAVSRGTAQMGHAAAYYWKGKVPEAQFFTAMPFGMTGMETLAWIYHGGGIELWEELYAQHDLVPFCVGSSDIQMGGWFNKRINSMEDIKGLKMRIPGLGGEVIERAGGSPVTLPGSEIFNALRTGLIDATEWVGPYNDLAFGLHRAARYYYNPGWHEPGTVLEGVVNKSEFDKLPADLQQVVRIACQAATIHNLAEFRAFNAKSFQNVLALANVEVVTFPDEVLKGLKTISNEVSAEVGNASPIGRRIYESYTTFMKEAIDYNGVSLEPYMRARSL